MRSSLTLSAILYSLIIIVGLCSSLTSCASIGSTRDLSSSASSLESRASSSSSSSSKCASCPALGQAGDSRCTMVSSFSTTSSKTGCPSCGCQKCPDLKYYANSVTNYCSSKPCSSCTAKYSSSPIIHCLIACPTDSRCKTLKFDTSSVACACACQKCPDGKTYGATSNYKKASALSKISIAKCPNVLHPVPKAQNLCS